MTLYISDCQNYYVSPGGADGYEDHLDPNSGLLTPGFIIACKECETTCSNIRAEIKRNPVYKEVLGVGTSCGMYAKSCTTQADCPLDQPNCNRGGQPDCPLGSHVEVDECVLNQEDMQEFVRAGQTAKIVGVKCLDTDHELNSQGLCVKKSKSNAHGKATKSMGSSTPTTVTLVPPSKDDGKKSSHKTLFMGLGAGLGVFLLILLALFLVHRNRKAVARFFMSSHIKSCRR